MMTLPHFRMSVAPRTAGPIAPPLELCLDLGIVPEARVAPQESAERPRDSNDSAETPTIAGNKARAAPHEPAECPRDAETPATSRKKGSLYSDRKKGKWPHEWDSLAKFEAWRRQEELAYSIELIRSTVKRGNELWLDKRLYVCSHQPSGGWKNYQKKHPERQRKINSKKSGCHCRIVIKRYHHMPTILGRYEVEHNHEVGLANLTYTRMLRMAQERIKSMLQLKMDHRKIIHK